MSNSEVKASASEVETDDTALGYMNILLGQFAHWPAEKKRLAVYSLLRDLLGERPAQESDVCDPEGFLYLHLVPPGLRERLRLLEHPELEEQLKASAAEPTFPLQQIREEIAVISPAVEQQSGPPYPVSKEQREAALRLIGIWKTDNPPSDEEVEQIIDEYRMKKYG